MKAYLITSDDCPPCEDLKEQFAKQLQSGEIEEKNLEKNGDEVTVLMNKYKANMPSLLIVDSEGELILSI